MSRSRAINRSNRLNAKKRRRTFRSVMPSLQDDLRKGEEPNDQSKDLIQKITEREVLFDLMEN